MTSAIRVAVIGVGHLGKEHARILAKMPHVRLVAVADANLDQARAVAQHCGTTAVGDYRGLLDQVDAACIATPTSTHAAIAADFLRRGVHLLVEKPLADSLTDAAVLVQLAQRHGAILQVGHIERFNPAFEELQRRPLQPKFLRAQRLGPFTGRSTDIGVVLDLMIHDLDLMLALTGATVNRVEALGISVFGGHEDVANARLHFTNGCVAELTASRIHPIAQRTLQVWAPEGFADVDFTARRVTFTQPSAAVRRQGLDPARLDPEARAALRDDLFGKYLETAAFEAPALDQLTSELTHFIECLRTGATPRVTGAQARDAVALAERIRFALAHHAWDGQADSPKGPHELPTPVGTLVPPPSRRQAA
ncbi:MAG: Gfo/Idh/MocA family oxidoreductase [Gemmataceae bacterium]|nr:Gfo/Idh/MocA family oxidoreductase [Gemmataceae bacterium]